MVCLRLTLMFCLTAYFPTATKSRNLTLLGGRVLHGTTGQRFAYPYMAELRMTMFVTDWKDNVIAMEGTCSGSILTPKLILTAAHCFHAGNQRVEEQFVEVEVRVGTTLSYNDPLTFQSRKARKIVVSPEFNPSDNPDNTKDDVALVILDASLVYNEEVNEIAVLKSEEEMLKGLEEGMECLVIGFGESGKGSGELRGDTTYLMTNEACKRKHCEILGEDDEGCTKEYLANGEICTLSEKISTCGGDSGSPLVCNHQVYGVLSYAIVTPTSETGCAPGMPNVFFNIIPIRKIHRQLFDDDELSELARYPKYKPLPNVPFVVEVRVYTGDNEEWGQFTGTIISTNLILTACNCVKEDNGDIVEASEVEVIAGAEPYIQKSRAKHIITHPACTKKLLNTGKERSYVFENNVAFLFLNSNLRFGEFVKSIDLGAPKFERDLIKQNVECQVYGYGMRTPIRYDEPPMNSLGIGTVWLDGEKKCRKRLCNVTRPDDDLCTKKNYFSSGLLCGVRDDTVNCFGNTGGPVVCQGYVFGVDSYWLPCKGRKCLVDGGCYDWPALFMNSVAISQLYGIIQNNKTLFSAQ